MPVTAVSNHNGTVSEETRLIYVFQPETGFSLFFSYIAGNVVDASTIKNTVAHLKKNGVDTNFAILDAGYYNGINADALYAAKISFMTRVHPNNKVFKDAVEEHRPGLECHGNFMTYNGRFYYIKRVECLIRQERDKTAYAYLGPDISMRDQQKKRLHEKLADTSFTSTALFEELRHQQGIVYDNAIVASIAVKKMNDIYKLFKIKCPDEIPILQ